ncbi:MAG: hypothetical protein WCJ63_09060, partial [Actinomycetes bacterium]
MAVLEDVKPLYFLPKDDLAGEVLIPAFRLAQDVDCMMGFFSSGVLSSLAPGLAAFVTRSAGTLRLIASPYLSPEDQKALVEGHMAPEEVASRTLHELLVTEDELQRHTLACLSYLVRLGRIQIKVALLKKALFHPKVWLFRTGGGTLAVHGSGNMTAAGVTRNFEQMNVSKEWVDPTQRYIVEKLSYQFGRLWGGHEEDCIVATIPDAARNELLRAYTKAGPPTEDEFGDLYEKALKQLNGADDLLPVQTETARGFHIPDNLRYDDGPFAHQGQAVTAWCEGGHRGILEMATGSGKTIAAMAPFTPSRDGLPL